MKVRRGTLPAFVAAVIAFAGTNLSGSDGLLNAGSEFEVDGKKARVIKFDSLPCVENDYSKRFKFDSAENPGLKELRDKYRLKEVVAPGKDEFDQQVLLMDWVHNRFTKFGWG